VSAAAAAPAEKVVVAEATAETAKVTPTGKSGGDSAY